MVPVPIPSALTSDDPREALGVFTEGMADLAICRQRQEALVKWIRQ